MDILRIAVVLSAVDRMSNVINSAAKNTKASLSDMMKVNFVEGAGLMAGGIAITKSMGSAVSAYSKLEDAQTNLKASMLSSSGKVDQNFQKVSDLAIELGNKLPGTTADFATLFQTMMENGMNSQNVLGGVGKAAAYLAVDLKMPYEAAGEFAARMKESTGIADDEMLKFMDTLSRAKSAGMDVEEIKYAFSRSAGTLKLMGLQGLKASNDMTAFYNILIRGGQSGQTAGTAFNSIMQNVLDPKKYSKAQEEAKKLGVSIQLFGKDGKFIGIKDMMGQLEKFKGMDPKKIAAFTKALVGGGGDAQALNTLIQKGSDGYKKMQDELAAKASLTDKVNLKLGTLSAMWEATTGTIENMLAALGAGLAPILKPIVDLIGKIAGKISDFLSANPEMAKFISMAVSLVGVFVTLLGAVKILKGIRLAMQLLNMTMKSNPFILFASIAILVLALIYSKWDKIKAFFIALWDRVKAIFQPVIDFIWKFVKYFTPIGLIIQFWTPIKKFFSAIWDFIKAVFQLGVTIIKAIMFAPVILIMKAWKVIGPWFKRNVWDPIKAPVMAIYNTVSGIFNRIVDFIFGIGKQLYQAGVNIITSIVDGITSVIHKVTDVIKGITQKIRNFLPFSPAKEGPLRDIHKIRLIETIAGGVKKRPLIDAVADATNGVVQFLNKPIPGVPSVQGSVGGAGMVANFNINLSGSATKTDGILIAAECKKQFQQWMKQYSNQQARINFS